MAVKFYSDHNVQEDFEHLIAFYRPETDRFLYPSYLLRKKRLRKYSFIVTAFKFDLVKRDYLMTIFNGIKTFFTIPTKLIRRKARKFPLSTYGRKKHLILIRTRDLEYTTHRFLKFRNLSAKMYKKHYLFRGFLPQVRPLNKVLFFTLMQHLKRITIFAHSWTLIKKRRRRTLNVFCIGFFLKLRKSKTYFRRKRKKNYVRGFRRFKKRYLYGNKRSRLIQLKKKNYRTILNQDKKRKRRKYKKLHMLLWRLKKKLLLKKIKQLNFLQQQTIPSLKKISKISNKKTPKIKEITLLRVKKKRLLYLYKLRQNLKKIKKLSYIRQKYRKKGRTFLRQRKKTKRKNLHSFFKKTTRKKLHSSWKNPTRNTLRSFYYWKKARQKTLHRLWKKTWQKTLHRLWKKPKGKFFLSSWKKIRIKFFFSLWKKTNRKPLRSLWKKHRLKYTRKSFRIFKKTRKSLLRQQPQKQRKLIFFQRKRLLLLYKVKRYTRNLLSVQRSKKKIKLKNKKKPKVFVKILMKKIKKFSIYYRRKKSIRLLKRHLRRKRILRKYHKKVFYSKRKKAFLKLKRKRISKLKLIFSRKYLLARIRTQSNKRRLRYEIYRSQRRINRLNRRRERRLRRRRWLRARIFYKKRAIIAQNKSYLFNSRKINRFNYNIPKASRPLKMRLTIKPLDRLLK